MQINRNDLLHELTFLSTVAEKKPTITVLSYFRFLTEGNQIKLRASNLDLTADTSIANESLESINICLPLFEAINALKNIGDDFIELTIEDIKDFEIFGV